MRALALAVFAFFLQGLAMTSPAAAAAATGLGAVWRPGTGVQWWRSGMSLDDFKSQDKVYFDQGLRVQSLAIKGGKYAAVWRPGSGAQWWRSGMSANDFKAQDKIYFDQGLRITALEIDNGQFAAVWRPGGGAQWWRSGMTVDDFKAQDKIYFDRGLRIRVLKVRDGSYTAVWQPGSGAQWWRSGMSASALADQDKIYFAQGLRITSLVNDHGRYAAVWQPGQGVQWWGTGRCGTDFVTEDSAHLNAGLRMELIELQDGAQGLYQFPWKSGDSHPVPQGNCPTGSGSGSHCGGGQNFAFDFGLPPSTTVRASRGGVVEWLQQSQTFNCNDPAPAPGCPGGAPSNWGNAVRIRHEGGFTSWYFHLKPNSVVVKVGDTVQAGQPIAASGNTGRSGGPHLHFQVQADSKDWGQTVAINFDQCRLPKSGDSVSSQNANSRFP